MYTVSYLTIYEIKTLESIPISYNTTTICKPRNRFVSRDQEQDYIRIDPGKFACHSTIGRKRGEQIVSVGNCKMNGILSWGRICHELMHVAGIICYINLTILYLPCLSIIAYKHTA